MKMQKIQFRIGELAKQLNVEKFVIRFWEKEFKVTTNRSHGGQRFYTQEDLEQFKQIKSLLYDQGFTIAGAKKLLDSQAPQPVPMVGSYKTELIQQPHHPEQQTEVLTDKIQYLKEKLVLLRDLL